MLFIIFIREEYQKLIISDKFVMNHVSIKKIIILLPGITNCLFNCL